MCIATVRSAVLQLYSKVRKLTYCAHSHVPSMPKSAQTVLSNAVNHKLMCSPVEMFILLFAVGDENITVLHLFVS